MQNILTKANECFSVYCKLNEEIESHKKKKINYIEKWY